MEKLEIKIMGGTNKGVVALVSKFAKNDGGSKKTSFSLILQSTL